MKGDKERKKRGNRAKREDSHEMNREMEIGQRGWGLKRRKRKEEDRKQIKNYTNEIKREMEKEDNRQRRWAINKGNNEKKIGKREKKKRIRKT